MLLQRSRASNLEAYLEHFSYTRVISMCEKETVKAIHARSSAISESIIHDDAKVYNEIYTYTNLQ